MASRRVFYWTSQDCRGISKKGSQVYVEGRIRTQKWQGQDGHDRYTTEIVADEMHMSDSRGSGSGQHNNTLSGEVAYERQGVRNDTLDESNMDDTECDDTIPFPF